jgi:1,2-diacylglycerol 3-alpha-glucosyltransferase
MRIEHQAQERRPRPAHADDERGREALRLLLGLLPSERGAHALGVWQSAAERPRAAAGAQAYSPPMRIGIVSYWFNRGQAVVSRQLRSALTGLGHETFVLARPTTETNIRSAFVDRGDVWDQPGITEASAYEIPTHEYLDWAKANALEVAFFDQNYGFEGISELRRSGVRTIGRFVWEQFSAADSGPAKEALDVIYSLTACEQERYAGFGIESPRVQWGIHPELLEFADSPSDEGVVTYFYPGGFLSKRKPIDEVLKGFQKARGDDLRLVVKAQVERKRRRLERAAERDSRIEFILEDQPTAEHLRRFASADVCLAPSRWEGLGLHLYEAMAFGMPVITNDFPPMNEVIADGVNGLLVPSSQNGEASSGIPAVDVSPRDLRRAIERLADPQERAMLTEGARRRRDELAWEQTVAGYAGLLELVA